MLEEKRKIKLVALLKNTTKLLLFTSSFAEGLKLGSVAKVLVMFIYLFPIYLAGIWLLFGRQKVARLII